MPVAPNIPTPLAYSIFENNGPGDSFMNLLYMPDTNMPAPQDFTIFAININTTACFNVGVYDTISELTYMSFSVGGHTISTTVLQKIDKGNYFYFKVTPVTIPFTPNSNACSLSFFEPSTLNVGFYNSDYNATLSNANFIRQSDFIHDVDRLRDQSIPTNYDAIIDQSAVKAPVQDSNYSSIGHQQSKYAGSKTSIDDYGLHSALGLVPFEGALYDAEKQGQSICSQSFSEKPIDDYSFTRREETLFEQSLLYPNNQNVFNYQNYIANSESGITPKVSYRTVHKDVVHEVYDDDPSNDSTNHQTNSQNMIDLDTCLGLGFHYSTTQGRDEGMEYYSNFIGTTLLMTMPNIVTPAGPKLFRYFKYIDVVATTNTNFKLVLDGTIDNNNATKKFGYPATLLTLNPGNTPKIFKPQGDTIYNTETNRLYKITNKKLYVAESDKVYYINSTGEVLHLEIDCSI